MPESPAEQTVFTDGWSPEASKWEGSTVPYSTVTAFCFIC